MATIALWVLIHSTIGWLLFYPLIQKLEFDPNTPKSTIVKMTIISLCLGLWTAIWWVWIFIDDCDGMENSATKWIFSDWYAKLTKWIEK